MGIQIGGPFVWSYVLGFFLIFAYFYLFLNIVFRPYSYKNFFKLILLLAILIFTQSKSVYLSLLLLTIITIMFIFFAKKLCLRKKIIIAIIIIIINIFFIFIILNNIDYLHNIARFLNYFEGGNIDSSTKTRLNQLLHVYSSLKSNVFFGYPTSNIIIENAYGYYLYYFGIIGFVGYLIILFSINYINYKIFKYFNKLNNMNMIILSYSFLMFTLSIYIFSLAASILDGHKASYLFWFILGIYYSIIYNYKENMLNEIFKN
jgi:O-antigen ligase